MLLTLIMTLSACNVSDNAAIVGNNLCDFSVKESSSSLIPIDSSTDEQIGVFERYADGSIQLTTFNGYAPIVTDCLVKKGLGNKLNLIPRYK